jgi:hypothetical protein
MNFTKVQQKHLRSLLLRKFQERSITKISLELQDMFTLSYKHSHPHHVPPLLRQEHNWVGEASQSLQIQAAMVHGEASVGEPVRTARTASGDIYGIYRGGS